MSSAGEDYDCDWFLGTAGVLENLWCEAETVGGDLGAIASLFGECADFWISEVCVLGSDLRLSRGFRVLRKIAAAQPRGLGLLGRDERVGLGELSREMARRTGPRGESCKAEAEGRIRRAAGSYEVLRSLRSSLGTVRDGEDRLESMVKNGLDDARQHGRSCIRSLSVDTASASVTVGRSTWVVRGSGSKRAINSWLLMIRGHSGQWPHVSEGDVGELTREIAYDGRADLGARIDAVVTAQRMRLPMC